MSKNSPEPPQEPPRRDCEGPYSFGVDRIPDSGHLDEANALKIGDLIAVERDAQGRPAIFSKGVLIGWPSTHEHVLDECMEKGFAFAGRVQTRRGYPAFPIIEVIVSGAR